VQALGMKYAIVQKSECGHLLGCKRAHQKKLVTSLADETAGTGEGRVQALGVKYAKVQKSECGHLLGSA
jgi:hypothetical protein